MPVSRFSSFSDGFISTSFGFWTTREKTVFSPADLSLQQGSPCSQAGFLNISFSVKQLSQKLCETHSLGGGKEE